MLSMPQSVILQGFYGSDESHALSAWTSTSRDLTEERMKRMPKLLKFLAENGHHTPFEKSMLHFLVRVDTASHIHLLKHRIGVSVNGESARYKELATPSYHTPEDWPTEWQLELDYATQEAYERYSACLSALEPVLGRKRAKESARFFLPYANQLTLDVSFNFRSFMHFLSLRHKEDAQKEIYDISEQMLELVRSTDSFTHSLAAFGYLND